MRFLHLECGIFITRWTSRWLQVYFLLLDEPKNKIDALHHRLDESIIFIGTLQWNIYHGIINYVSVNEKTVKI